MERSRHVWAGLGLGLAATGLSSCSMVDAFGPRAVAYNRQLASERREIIIDNIVRSAQGQLLQFSEVSTITGQISGQLGIGGVLPILGSSQGTGRLYDVNPAAQLSGGPSFTVSNLNTQEFYAGITAPIKPEIISSYVDLGYPREFLLPLVVSSISFRQDGREYSFRNDPGTMPDYQDFASLLQALIDGGLTFENTEQKDFIGPALMAADIRSANVMASLVQGGGEEKRSLASFSVDDAHAELSDADRSGMRKRGEHVFYRLVQVQQIRRYCFSSEVADAGGRINSEAVLTLPSLSMRGHNLSIRIGPSLRCRSDTAGPTPKDMAGLSDFTVTSRSVHGVFDYLGMISREELQKRAPDRFDRSTHDGMIRLFGIEEVPREPADARLGSGLYRIARLGREKDGSDRSIQLLSELTALYSSAKSFQPPSVVQTIGR